MTAPPQPPAPVVVYGAGGHAKVVAQTLARTGRWRVAGFIDDAAPERAGTPFCGATVLGGEAALAALHAAGTRSVVLAFGDNAARQRVGARLAAQGWQLPVVVDPSAQVADDAALAAGVFVGSGAIVEPGVRIGEFTIVNSAATVCHDVAVGAAVHLCPRVCLGGHARVDDGAWIGIGAVLKDRVRVGAGAVIGAGAVVVSDIAAGVVAYGVPAKAGRKG